MERKERGKRAHNCVFTLQFDMISFPAPHFSILLVVIITLLSMWSLVVVVELPILLRRKTSAGVCLFLLGSMISKRNRLVAHM